ncbi:MAG: hypothetical protein ACE5JF_09780 [Anaerolineales bacterium]
MTISNLVRWSGIAAIVGGAGNILASIVSPELGSPLEWVFIIAGVATMFALIGIYAFQVEESGWSGFLGFVLAMTGNAFFVGASGSIAGLDAELLGGTFYALGLILLAVGFWRAGKLPRWVPALWILATVVGVPGFFLEGFMALSFTLGAVFFGLGFIGSGYTLWSVRAEPAGRATSAA